MTFPDLLVCFSFSFCLFSYLPLCQKTKSRERTIEPPVCYCGQIKEPFARNRGTIKAYTIAVGQKLFYDIHSVTGYSEISLAKTFRALPFLSAFLNLHVKSSVAG